MKLLPWYAHHASLFPETPLLEEVLSEYINNLPGHRFSHARLLFCTIQGQGDYQYNHDLRKKIPNLTRVGIKGRERPNRQVLITAGC